ncbi:MAG: glycosyltransferase [Prochloraceae cyanobacterium]
MYIGLIAHFRGPKLGIGQYLERLLPPLVAALEAKEMKVKILASPNAIEKTAALKELKDYVSVIPALDYSPTKRYLWFFSNFASCCREAGITKVVFLSNPIVLPWHPPTVAVIHDVNEWKTGDKYGSTLKTKLRSLIYLDASINFAKKIITVSQLTKKDLLYFRPNAKLKEKSIAIPNGSDSSLVDLPPVSIPAPEKPFILSVGRIDPAAKRLFEAVNLVAAIREESGRDWELHLVGGLNKSTQSAGEEFLKALDKISWATYHGHVDDRALAEWYRRCQGVVYLSDNEGFGFPIAEAVSFGRWAIVSDRNFAAIEAGGDAPIAIDPKDSRAAAVKILQKFNSNQAPMVNLQTWVSAAEAYTNVISLLNEEVK